MTSHPISPALLRLDHYNIETTKPQQTIDFYVGALGMQDLADERPDFGIPGTWFGVDDRAVIHVNFVGVDRSAPTGAIDHVAFEGVGYAAMTGRLDSLNVAYDVVERPEIDLCQIYVRDPNQVLVEINIRGECSTL